MKSTVLIVTLACALPGAAGAQQSVQAQGGASAQGNASIAHTDNGQTQTQATASGSGSAAVSTAHKSGQADKGGKPAKSGKPDTADKAGKAVAIDSAPLRTRSFPARLIPVRASLAIPLRRKRRSP